MGGSKKAVAMVKASSLANGSKTSNTNTSVSHIKNKQKRAEIHAQRQVAKRKAKEERKLKRKREEQELGVEAPPKQVPKTLDSMREADETVVDADDDEVENDAAADEFAGYFDGTIQPKIMITTRPRPSRHLFGFVGELMELIPNAYYYKRESRELKQMIEWASEKKFTHLIVLGEKAKKCNQMLISHLPNGPTALFKVSNLLLRREIQGHGKTALHTPEVILNRFTTRLGHRVGRFLGALFPHQPNFRGRQVVTIHNQRDFIFIRHHRYVFNDKLDKARLQELGPKFTLKMKWLMNGTFDTQHGEYEWLHNSKKMDTSRKRFFL